MAAPENTGAKQTGRYKPGQSGNPSGKPKGTRHRATQMLGVCADEPLMHRVGVTPVPVHSVRR